MSETVLITGTTSGIGEQLAIVFATNKYNLILVGRNKVEIEKQKRKLESTYSVNVNYIIKNLEEEDAAEYVYNEVKKKKLNVDILVNNAGFNECGEFIETNKNNEMDMINLHIKTLTGLTKYFSIDMVVSGKGKILNLGSTGSFMPCPLDAVYAATKSYVLSFSKAIHAELKKKGVSVTTICPGATKTQFAKKADIESTLLFRIGVMSPTKVAQVAYKALMRKKRYKVVGIYNKILVLSSYITPSCITDSLTIKMMKR